MDENEFIEVKEISLKEMDELTKELRELKAKAAACSKAEKDAKAEVSRVEEKILSNLNAANLDTFIGAGGRVTRVRKLAVRIPQTPEEKKKFFDWLTNTQGQEVADHFMTVNSQALNSLYNSLVEEYGARGEVLEIDGLELPTYRENLSFTKA